MRLREVNVSGSRGCYGSCTFCTINPFYGGRSLWRPRSPESVIAEMAAVLEEHPDTSRFYFVDPNFFGPAGRGRVRALTLARMIRERFDIRFGLEGRVNDIDEELVENLVAAGFDELLIGLESGSDATLRRLNKHTTVEQNRRALRILRSLRRGAQRRLHHVRARQLAGRPAGEPHLPPTRNGCSTAWR